MSERKVLPDILKGIAVILMIQVHLMEKFAKPEVYDSWLGMVSLFFGGVPAAPVFMAVMGFFIAFSKKGFKENVFRGAKLILMGLILNLLLNTHLLLQIINGTVEANPWQFIFGVDILFLAGLSILLIAVFRTFLKDHIIGWMAVMLVFASLNQYLPVFSDPNHWLSYIQAFFYGYIEWSYFPLFPWFAYPLAGYVFYLLVTVTNVHQLTKINKMYVGTAALLIVLITFNYGLKNSVSLNQYYHHSLVFFLWTLAFLLFWIISLDLIFHNKINSFFTRYLIWTGKNVTAFYVIQWLLIGNIGTALYRSQNEVQFFLWFLLLTFLTSVFVVIMNKLKEKILFK